MEMSFERGDEIGRETRQLPAGYYKKILLLLLHSNSENLFVPIRTMQYLAIVDREEIVFVDGQGPRLIELAWCDFHAGEREDLHAPVLYTCVYYRGKGRQEMFRLQGEFLKALELVEGRQPKAVSTTVTPIVPHDD